MIQPALVRRLSGITLLLALALSALAFAAGSARVAGGVAAGAVLGLLPIVTWSVLGGLLLPSQQPAEAAKAAKAAAPLLFGVISLGKLLLYALALAILIGRNLVDPLAFAGALLVPSLLLAIAVSVRRPEAAR